MSDGSNSSHSNGNGSPAEGEGKSSFDLSGDIQKLQEQAEKSKNDYLYLRAEFENYKKHAIKERSDIVKYGAERVVRDLLGVLDNFERALSTQITPENFAIFRQGVELTANELRATLAKNGVTEVKSEGHPFDPSVHEALTSEVSDSVPAGNVLRVFQKAYKLHDKLIRPAQVVVAKRADS